MVTHITRPHWLDKKYDDKILNLSNNICYDYILTEQINSVQTIIDYRQYPDEFVAYEVLSKEYNVDPNNIAIGYGLGELIHRVFKLPAIKQIHISGHSWPMAQITCDSLNIPHSKENGNTLYIANPNGIDGTYLSKDDVLKLLDLYELVIIDEAYGDYCAYDYSVLQYAINNPKLVVLKTLSKTLNLAGLRFGYCFGDNTNIEHIQRLRFNSVCHPATLQLLPHIFEFIPAHVTRMTETKQYIESTFDCVPSQGNYVLFKKQPTDKFLMKNVNGLYRMALTNLDVFKNAIN